MMLATVLKRQGRIMCMCALNQLLLLRLFRKTNISFMEAGARDSINHSCVIANNVFKKYLMCVHFWQWNPIWNGIFIDQKQFADLKARRNKPFLLCFLTYFMVHGIYKSLLFSRKNHHGCIKLVTTYLFF